MMDNYALALQAARRRFLGYPESCWTGRAGVTVAGDRLTTTFLGRPAAVSLTTGEVFLPPADRPADYAEALSIYDWLCDSPPDARAAGEYCPVTSLPGVYVGGGGLTIGGTALAQAIEDRADGFFKAVEALGGRPIPLGDLGAKIPIFPGLSMCLKFYHEDDEFPPTLTLLWDKNTLAFLRYETVYYIASCLQKYLLQLIRGPDL